MVLSRYSLMRSVLDRCIRPSHRVQRCRSSPGSAGMTAIHRRTIATTSQVHGETSERMRWMGADENHICLSRYLHATTS